MSEKNERPPQDFDAFADDGAVLGVGNMDIDNAVDRVTLTGDVVLTKDRQGLQLARQLQAVLDSVVRTLEAENSLPEKVEVESARTVRNPFS